MAHAVGLAAAAVPVVEDFLRCLTSFRFNHVLGDEIRCTYSLSMNEGFASLQFSNCGLKY